MTFYLEPGDTGEALLVPKANAEGVHADRDGSEAPRGGVPSTGQPETRGAGDTVPTADEWITEERWVPVTEAGDRWEGRSEWEAEESMLRWPVGGTFSDGERWDGISHIEREVRQVTAWTVRP